MSILLVVRRMLMLMYVNDILLICFHLPPSEVYYFQMILQDVQSPEEAPRPSMVPEIKRPPSRSARRGPGQL